jgi:N-acetylmuramoyl-L-alanine amidase
MRKLKVIVFLFLFLQAAGGICEDRELSAVLEDLGAYLSWNPLREIGVMLIGADRVAFKLGVPFILVDYNEKLTIDPPARKDGAIFFSSGAVDTIRNALARSRLQNKQEGFRVSTILIDPGHGGEDPGAVDEVTVDGKTVQIREKDVVLAIARNLSDLLLSTDADKQILLTRTADDSLSLEKRYTMANALLEKTSDSILYISVHANRSLSRQASGFEVWYLPPEYKRTLIDEKNPGNESAEILPILNSILEEEISVESTVLAQEILDGLEATVGKVSPNRGPKQQSWAVVRNTMMPAVLVEVGFLSNPEEAARLTQEAYLKRIAEGIYNGIQAFISRLEHTGSSSAR